MRLGAIQLSAILASLLLSAGLVLRISATLTPVAPETRSDTAAKQAIQVRDDVNGLALFDAVHLSPGVPEERCITVRATGTRTPEEVRMRAASSVDGDLAPWLRLTVDEGPALDRGRDCTGFDARTTVAAGGIVNVLEQLDSGITWEPDPADAIPGGHAVTYRLRAELLGDAPNEIMGTASQFDLNWSTTFDPAGEDFLGRSLAVAIRFTEDSMIPMLAIVALGILFLGVQDRLDSATPRLSQAALFDEVIEFESAGPGPQD